MSSRSRARAPFLGVALASSVASSAQMRLSPLVRGAMAIQRGVQVPVWRSTGPALFVRPGSRPVDWQKDTGARLALPA